MNELFYTREAMEWSEALPLGSGKLGAMVFGNVNKDRVQLNEETMWYGSPMNRINPNAYENLDMVRELILSGEIQEVEQLLRYAFTGTPQGMRRYQSGGDFWLRPEDTVTPITEYSRRLSLEKAVAEVTYKQGEVTYTRTYFISEKYHTLIIEISSDCKGTVNVDGLVTRNKDYDTVGAVADNLVMLKGNLGKGGMDFALAFTAACEGGSIQTIGENIVIRNADKARFYITEGTTFTDYLEDFLAHDCDCDFTQERLVQLLSKEAVWKKRLEQRLIQTLEDVREAVYEELLEEHILCHRELYDRVSLEIEQAEEAKNSSACNSEDLGDGIEEQKTQRTTEQRLAAVKEGGVDNALMCLYFNYGRYLMITGSRPGGLPLNLQGIWNDKMDPPWDSKYTVNINTEMNYWPVEICNLPECHEPLFDLLRRAVKRGQQTAREMYGCRGFVIHHNTDIWADTAPQDIWLPGTYWVMGGAWLCAHLWMHYEYTRDVQFLASVYDILEQAVLFFCDYLTEKDGKVILCPSVSPENTYILPNGNRGCVCFNSTMDIMILRELLQNFLDATKVLQEIRQELVEQASDILAKLPTAKIGKYGQIMEWSEDYEEKDPGHRHISHLYGLHPGNEITPDATPELAEGARKTLERRLAHGGGYTGWSCAWLINFYAKLWDGESALKMLKKLLSESTDSNLMDTHPGKNGSVFQIDGNLGACAAILHMLIQSNSERVVLLPACPKEWNSGRLQGVKVVGNATVDITWKAGEITECTIHAFSDWKKEVHYRGRKYELSLQAGESVCMAEEFMQL